MQKYIILVFISAILFICLIIRLIHICKCKGKKTLDSSLNESVRIYTKNNIKEGWNQYAPLDYKNSTHQFIAWNAMQLLKKGGYEDVYEWLFRYWNQIGRGLWDGDFLNPWYNGGTTKSVPHPLYNDGFKSHFYDPYTGTNLLGEVTMTASSYTMLGAYNAGYYFNKITKQEDVSKYAASAFYDLGIGLHYFTDLSQPCHSHNFGALNWPQAFHTFIEVTAQNFIKEYDFDFTCKPNDKCFDIAPLENIINYQAEEAVKVYEFPYGTNGDCKYFALAEDTAYGPYSIRKKDEYSIAGTCFGPGGSVETCSSWYSPLSYSYLRSCWKQMTGKDPGSSISAKDAIIPMIIKQITSGVQQTARFMLSWFYEYGKNKCKVAGPNITIFPDKNFPSLDNPPSSCQMDSHCYWDRRIDDCNCTFPGCDKSKCKALPGSIVKGYGNERYGTCVCTDTEQKTCSSDYQCSRAFKPTGQADKPWLNPDYLDQCQSYASEVTSTGCKYNASKEACECSK